MARSFWSEGIETVTVRAPLAVVSEAASQLVGITQGLVEANVRTGATKTGYLVHRLFIEAPALNYKVHVANFTHLPVPLYPVWASVADFGAPVYREGQTGTYGGQMSALFGLSSQKEPPGEKLQGEEQLVAWLTEFLGGDSMKSLVNGLIATVNVGTFHDGEVEED